MVWLILRLFLLVAGAAVVGLTIRTLVTTPGLVWFEWGGQIYEMRPLVFVVAALLTVVALLMVVALVRLALGGPSLLRRLWAGRKQRLGLAALSNGLTALAMHDGKAALSALQQAERQLGDPSLTRVPMTQALRLIGDDKNAALYEQALTTEGDTAYLGWRAQAERAVTAGDSTAALAHAQAALRARAGDDWAMGQLLALWAAQGDWASAKAMLSKTKADRATRTRHEAALLLAEAQDLIAQGRAEAALPLALDAAKHAPAFAPAACLAAQLLGPDHERKATRLLLDAWRAAPHPALADSFAALAGADQQDKLLAVNDSAPYARVLRARLALAAGDPAKAAEALNGLPDQGAVAALRARIAQAQGQDVTPWLALAVSGQSGWHCGACGQIHPHWQATCTACRRFDRLEWVGTPAEADLCALLGSARPTAKPIRLIEAPSAVPPPAPVVQQRTEPDQAVRTADAGWDQN